MLAGDCVHIYGWPSTGNITGPDNQEMFFPVCQFSQRWKANVWHPQVLVLKYTEISKKSKIFWKAETMVGGSRQLRVCLSTCTWAREKGQCGRKIKELEMRRQRRGGKPWCCNYQGNHLWVRNTSPYIRDTAAVSLKSLLQNYSMLTGHLCAVTLRHSPAPLHTHTPLRQTRKRCFISKDTKKES